MYVSAAAEPVVPAESVTIEPPPKKVAELELTLEAQTLVPASKDEKSYQAAGRFTDGNGRTAGTGGGGGVGGGCGGAEPPTARAAIWEGDKWYE